MHLSPSIPIYQWQPLTLAQTVALFQPASRSAPFRWALAGGYCIEQFVGRSFRHHDDVDVMVFRDEQLAAQAWLADWCWYAADPPGQLRNWLKDEHLPFGIHDIWGHKPDSDSWQLQLMLAEIEGENGEAWFFRKDPTIRGKRDDLIALYNGLPCVRIEVQLFYKARSNREKDNLDFEQCLPLLRPESVRWLRHAIQHTFPQGHGWLARLS